MLGVVVLVKKPGLFFRCKDESYAFLEVNLNSFPVQSGDAVFFHGELREARTLSPDETIEITVAQKTLDDEEAAYLEHPDSFLAKTTEEPKEVLENTELSTIVCKVYHLCAGTTPLFTILPCLRLLGKLLPIKRTTSHPMFYRAHFVQSLVRYYDADIAKAWAAVDQMCINALDNARFSFRREANKVLSAPLRADEEMGFFRAWREQKVHRGLRLLGLEPSEIAKCGLPLHDIPGVLTSTPHRVSGLDGEYIKRLERTLSLEDAGTLREDREILHWLEATCTERKCLGLTFREVAVKGRHALAACSRMLGVSVESAPSPDGNMMNTVLCPLRLFRLSEKIADFVVEQLETVPVWAPLPCRFTRDDLNALQKTAVQTAIDNNLAAIIGAPGTGKTTIISQIVSNLERWNIPVLLLTNNGIAAYRVQEAIGTRHCSTVQMYVNTLRNTDAVREFKLVKHIVLDEASTISSATFAYLLDKMRQYGVRAKVTLIGDPGQLEAIGAGLFFEQLVQGGHIPCVRLEHVYRTDEDLIRANCIAIVKRIPPLVTGPKFRIEKGGLPRMYQLMKIFRAAGRNVTEFAVLCPWAAPLNDINERVREIFGVGDNESRPDPKDSRRRWYVGDKVRQTVNDHKRQCYNGSQGIVESFSDTNGETKMCVRFKFGLLEYDFRYLAARTAKSDVEGGEYYTATGSLTDLDLAYALTVHNAQAMEWEVVMLYIPPNKYANKRFLNSRVAYVAFSRGKEMVMVFGEENTIQKAAFLSPEGRADPLLGLLTNKLKK